MKNTGIIAEFDPFHNGHAYLLKKARENGAEAITVIMSGNFVQRGDTAIISKFARTKAALSCGADLVVELPTYYAMATAQKFALGGVAIAKNLLCDTLCFGSESGISEDIMKTVYCIRSSEFSAVLREKLDSGLPPAKAREQAVEKLCGTGHILTNPNDILAVEYANAVKELDSGMKILPIKRFGAEHGDTGFKDGICSASAIRELVFRGEIEICRKFMPEASFEILKEEYENGRISDVSLLDKFVLSTLRTSPIEDYKALPDISEGIENRLYSIARQSGSIKELAEKAATKRYTRARMRRLILAAALKERKADIPDLPPYIRVLGCNKTGAEVLQNARGFSALPIIMRSTTLKSTRTFDFEAKATDIYSLTFREPAPCGEEFTNGVIVMR